MVSPAVHKRHGAHEAAGSKAAGCVLLRLSGPDLVSQVTSRECAACSYGGCSLPTYALSKKTGTHTGVTKQARSWCCGGMAMGPGVLSRIYVHTGGIASSVPMQNHDVPDWQMKFCNHLEYVGDRKVPLSEGRIEPSNGTLMCSFHGWCFNGEGNCVNIPQVASKLFKIPGLARLQMPQPVCCCVPGIVCHNTLSGRPFFAFSSRFPAQVYRCCQDRISV